MALDVFVMPLWMYFAGDYKTAAERRATADVPVVRTGAPKPSLKPDAAVRKVVAIQHALTRNGSVVTWHDGGYCHFEQEFDRQGWHALQAFAAHQDYPIRMGFFRRPAPFTLCDKYKEHPGLLEIADGAKTRFPHLIKHTDSDGFYIPGQLVEPIALAPGNRMIVGSSDALLAELNKLGPLLEMKHDYGELVDGENIVKPDDPLRTVKYGWAFMRLCARISVEKRLPIIFDG